MADSAALTRYQEFLTVVQVAATEASIEQLMVVGHNPGMTELFELLTAEPLDNLPTFGVARLAIECPWSALERGPRALDREPGHSEGRQVVERLRGQQLEELGHARVVTDHHELLDRGLGCRHLDDSQEFLVTR